MYPPTLPPGLDFVMRVIPPVSSFTPSDFQKLEAAITAREALGNLSLQEIRSYQPGR